MTCNTDEAFTGIEIGLMRHVVAELEHKVTKPAVLEMLHTEYHRAEHHWRGTIERLHAKIQMLTPTDFHNLVREAERGRQTPAALPQDGEPVCRRARSQHAHQSVL